MTAAVRSPLDRLIDMALSARLIPEVTIRSGHRGPAPCPRPRGTRSPGDIVEVPGFCRADSTKTTGTLRQGSPYVTVVFHGGESLPTQPTLASALLRARRIHCAFMARLSAYLYPATNRAVGL